MSSAATSITITLPLKAQPILDSLKGETPDKKLAHLLVSQIRRNLEACGQDRLDLETEYGMEYGEFGEELMAGALGGEFSCELEMDALWW